MTKKDGDKIRAFQQELLAMTREYPAGTVDWEAAVELNVACDLTLRGKHFEVRS